MSKHPIPDWLRSQFSVIEDEVRKLGPCGVFTQMRTVTQTYFKQQAEAHQPPALGGEPIKRYDMSGFGDGMVEREDGAFSYFDDLAPLQAEIERTNARLHDVATLCASVEQERDQLKARCDQLAQLSPEAFSVMKGMVEHCINVRACMGMDEGFKSFDPDEEHDFVKELRAFALSKPAGSEQV